MNKQRRQHVGKVIELLNQARDMADNVLDEENDCLSNMPENLQDSLRCSDMEDAIDNLESSIDSIDSAIDYLNEAIN